ncbi:MAG: sigma-54-dependent Fis family transcriptional regulator [Acidobacteria bacterium]|nr:sigma-54-dependent Fis family transcriptional regulator [Acidobacteriota bacterium]
MAKDKVLIVDDDPLICRTIAGALRAWGYDPIPAGAVSEALAALDTDEPAAALLDISLPDGSGLDLLSEITKRRFRTVPIIITGDVQADEMLSAFRGGAYDFIGKPIRLDELQVTLRNGIDARRMRRELGIIRREQTRQFNIDQIIGQSPAMTQLAALTRKVAESEASSVLLQGESGTGKDLVAKAIHYGSRRANAPFVAVNCAAIPATLIESELFGHEKGAFTDARARKEGLFEQAEGGTIFLDEIGDLEISLQAKLLRILEEGTFRRVGGLKDLPLDVRVIAASNRDLRTEGEAERFRLDLYYRLSVIEIDLPPLRERGDDMLVLAEHFIADFNERLRKRVRGLAPEAISIFRHYSWPGNVRELRNAVERAMILEDGDIITTAYLPAGVATASSLSAKREAPGPAMVGERAAPGDMNAAAHLPNPTGPAGVEAPLFRLPQGGISLDQLEMSMVEQAMELSGRNQKRAAKLLGISRDRLRWRLKKLGQSLACGKV